VGRGKGGRGEKEELSVHYIDFYFVNVVFKVLIDDSWFMINVFSNYDKYAYRNL